ncbi:hypothetical protein BU26DRAFT_532893 [Trematosphaeria pertusa]|uniref:Apple domain-containing protein n=1 Tax=Trematosphaeria pertusa TaxID=390896 RepID=A0A6A6I807_9PLEO|nr:uncharacterized protein BU26DRAFT_532893 [Trematosphaeria pertusa]KAF2246349.1 hypothetical protein BU26DRAFT_532893 [Trematosphaeria pertusa]
MRLPTLLTALAAVTLPSLSTAQSTTQLTSATTLCRTRYGIYPLPTGTAGVPTWYSSSTTTNTIHSTSTTQTTITVTPDATTFTDVLTSTSVITTTTTSTPDAVTVPTSAGQLLLLGAGALQVAPTPAPTGGMSRIKRAQLADADAAAFLPLKRQTPTGNSAGFIAYPNGTYSGLYRRYAHRVDCRVLVTIDETVVTVVTALPETQVLPQQTETALVTTTVLSTVTETRVAATPTVYAACGADNVVNHIIDINGQPLYFDRVIYRPTEGFPINQEVVLYTDSDIECCEACQTTPYCAGSFYAPGVSECHLRLTQPPTPYPPTLPSGTPLPSSNTTLPSATGTMAVAPISTGTPTPGNGTCAAGSLSLYMGMIRGSETFPREYALSFSNGPCGRLSVHPIPVDWNVRGSLPKRGMEIAAN